MKKKNILMALTAGLMLIMTVFSATAFNYTVNGTTVTTGTPQLDINLYAWDTTYHMNSAPQGRNSLYPTYEYQFSGERVHFTATIRSNSVFATENAVVTAVMQCPIAGNFSAPLTRTSPSSYNSGYYLAEYQGDWVIPDATTVSENCPIGVSIVYGVNSAFDNLNNPLYSEVNDVLANPLIMFSESAPLTYPNPTFNALNNANPFPQVLTITSGDVDQEGQGFLGDMYKYVHRMCGATFGDCIAPSAQRVSLTGGPGTYNNVVDSSVVLGSIMIGSFESNAVDSFNLYWQLQMPGNVAPDTYTSVNPDYYLLEIY